MENHIIIRPMIDKDGWQVEQNGLIETLSCLTESPPLKDYEVVKALIAISQHERGKIFVADDKGQIVGFIKLIYDTKFSHGICRAGRIEDVVVRKSHEGLGLARKLIKKAIEYAKNQCCYKITLDCRPELVEFYSKFNFHSHEISMRLDL